MYPAKLSCCVAILDFTIRDTGHDTPCFPVMWVFVSKGRWKAEGESQRELHGAYSTVCAVREGHSCSGGDGLSCL